MCVTYWAGVYEGHPVEGVRPSRQIPPYLLLLFRATHAGPDLRDRARQYWSDLEWGKVEDDRLVFLQTDSGCRFAIRLKPVEEQGPHDQAWPLPGHNQLVVLLRTLQPPVYPREVTETLEPMVRSLNLEMALPQDPDPTFGPWSPSRVLLAWRNLHRKTLADWRQPPYHLERFVGRLPAAEIERIWQWNRSRGDRQAALEEDVFIPLIDYVDLGDGPQTRVAWPDGIPIYLPKVDFILAGFGTQREGVEPGTPEFTTWVPWASLEPLLSRYSTLTEFRQARRLVYDQPPPDLLEVLRSGLRVRQAPWVVPFSRVLADEDFRGGPDSPASA